MSELPDSWVRTPLRGAIKKIVGGGTPSKANPRFFSGSIPFMTVKDLSERFPTDTIDHITEEAVRSSSTTVVLKDTLIVATRMSLGKVVRPRFDTAINQDLKALHLQDGFDKTYIEYLWRHLANHIQALGTGTTVKGIRLDDIYNLEVPVAPSAEQKRIADKLEAVLGRVDACRARLDRIPDLLKRFRQSVLAAANSGQLTEDWRLKNDCNSKPWVEYHLDQLCEKGRIITYGVIKLGEETPGGVPCLRTSDIRWLHIDVSGIKRIAKSLSLSYTRTILRGGEVLVNVRGTLGGVAVAENSMDGWNVSREVAVIPVNRRILLPQFLAFWIGSNETQRWLGRVKKGVAYTGINIEDLRCLPVKAPSLCEQQEIVRRVEELFAFADRIEASLAKASAQAERLTPAILSKAFRGKLVPQDPNDEPASILLQRLKSMTAEVPQKNGMPRPRRLPGMQSPKSSAIMTKSRTDEDVKGQPYLAKILRNSPQVTSASELFKLANLPVIDFYKQLSDEIDHGHIKDSDEILEAAQ